MNEKPNQHPTPADANRSRLEGKEALELLSQLERAQSEREAVESANAIEVLKLWQFPTPAEARDIIARSVGQKRRRILSHHAYWKENKLREGINALFSTASLAYADVCRHDAALTAFSQRGDFQDHIDHTVGNPAQKDVMAFCAAAAAIVDTTRRIRKCRPDIEQEIGTVIDECFANDVSAFIKDLRKNLSHGSVVIPGWNISTDRDGVATGTMAFQAEDLLSFGEWGAAARRYIAQAIDGRVDIEVPVKEYFVLLNRFHSRLNDLFARNATDAERDYFDIADSFRRIASGQWTKVLVSQFGKGKNPYDHLHRFFTREEVREIRRRPDHSKEQVDYIISLRTVETACDDDLRRALYQLFGVASQS